MSLRRISALAVVGALLASGCQDEPEPRFEDPTESPTASASESSDPPERQTAEAFIREWFRTGTEMQNTGETDDFLNISSECTPCHTFARQIAHVYEAGGYVRIKSERVIDIRKLPGRPASKPEFVVKVDSSPTTFKKSSNAKTGSYPGGKNSYQVSLQQTGSSWNVTDYLDMT